MDIEVSLKFDTKLAQWKARCEIPKGIYLEGHDECACPDVMETIGGSIDHVMAITRDFFSSAKNNGCQQVNVVFKFDTTLQMPKDNVVPDEHPIDRDKLVKTQDYNNEIANDFEIKESLKRAETKSLERAESIVESLTEKSPQSMPECDQEMDVYDEMKVGAAGECIVDERYTCDECGTDLAYFKVQMVPDYVNMRDEIMFFISLKASCPVCGHTIEHPDIARYNCRAREIAISRHKKRR